jgi:hypothetical protein
VIYSLDFDWNWDRSSLAQRVFVWKSNRGILVMGNAPDFWSSLTMMGDGAAAPTAIFAVYLIVLAGVGCVY